MSQSLAAIHLVLHTSADSIQTFFSIRLLRDFNSHKINSLSSKIFIVEVKLVYGLHTNLKVIQTRKSMFLTAVTQTRLLVKQSRNLSSLPHKRKPRGLRA